jgi:hypothetical protein
MEGSEKGKIAVKSPFDPNRILRRIIHMTTENFARYVAEFGGNNLAREVDAESAITICYARSGNGFGENFGQ